MTSVQNCSRPLSDSELLEILSRYRSENWKGIQTPDVQARIVEELLHGDASAPLQNIAPYVAVSGSTRILDLGCGVGSFVVACRKRGLQCFGIEPDRMGVGSKLSSIQVHGGALRLNLLLRWEWVRFSPFRTRRSIWSQ